MCLVTLFSIENKSNDGFLLYGLNGDEAPSLGYIMVKLEHINGKRNIGPNGIESRQNLSFLMTENLYISI